MALLENAAGFIWYKATPLLNLLLFYPLRGSAKPFWADLGSWAKKLPTGWSLFNDWA